MTNADNLLRGIGRLIEAAAIDMAAERRAIDRLAAHRPVAPLADSELADILRAAGQRERDHRDLVILLDKKADELEARQSNWMMIFPGESASMQASASVGTERGTVTVTCFKKRGAGGSTFERDMKIQSR
jgi:hypothetical protein